MNEKLSVIVPVYNIADYLERCVDSLLAQTYTNIEIILVDNGSTDNSYDISLNYEKNYSNVFAYHIEENSVSAARNMGIEKSTGKYITFVDSDDWVDENAYDTVMKYFDDNINAIFFGFRYIIENRIDENTAAFKGLVQDGLTAFVKCIEGDYYNTMVWNKVFRKDSLLTQNGYIEFDKRYLIGEDEIWIYHYLKNNDNIYFCDQAFYNWYMRSGSAIHAVEKVNRNYLNRVEVKRFLLDEARKSKNNDFIKYAQLRYYSILYRVIRIAYKEGNKKYVRENIKELFKIRKEWYLQKGMWVLKSKHLFWETYLLVWIKR